jgi:exopolysaccharide biosynthesis predicted pyruvyltransferase EpsI
MQGGTNHTLFDHSTTSLDDYFRSNLANCDLCYVPNFGNAGDALIGLGSMEFFERLGLKWRLCGDWRRVRGETVVFAGGGALIGHYKRSELVFSTLLKNGNRVIVLPHTITQLNPSLLEWGQNLTIFCRERRTYSYLSRFTEIHHIGLAHDMAFQLTGRVEKHFRGSLGSMLFRSMLEGSPKDRLRVLKRLPRALRTMQRTHRLSQLMPAVPLNCFRRDVESIEHSVPADNHDISNEFAMGTETVATIRLSGAALLSVIARFDEIRTDRLHCCIAAILLKKKAQFFANNYHKNQSVYQFSIKDKTSHVFWNGPETHSS